MVMEIRLKKALKDREFLVLYEEELSATVELDTWNRCDDVFYKKYKDDKRFEFRKPDGELLNNSFPQNRQQIENIKMVGLRRTIKS